MKIPTFVKFYNEERPHRSIEMLTPSMAYKMEGELKRKWKSYYPSKKNHTAVNCCVNKETQ